MNMYNGSPIDIDFEDGPYESDGETVRKESTNTTTERTVKTEHWPHNATRKAELNEDQIEVIETAVRYPYTSNIAKLNRLCNYTQNRTSTYAHTTLNEHWPERTTDSFDPEQIQTEEIDQAETTSDNDELLQMENTMNTSDSEASSDDRLTIEPVSEEETDDETTDTNNVEWPDNATGRDQLHSDQIAVIETAVKNPDVTSTGTLTELADISEDRNPYYAHDVLNAHWKSRLLDGDNTDSTSEERVESEGEWPDNVKPREEMNDNQIAVIEAAMEHGDSVSNARELTDIADVDDVAKYYGYDVLYTHWPEKLDEIKGNTTTMTLAEEEQREVTGDITELPDEVGDVDDFNETQLRVFEAVLKNPSVTNASEITRIAEIDDEYDISYGNSLLRRYWPEWREYDSEDTTDEVDVDEERDVSTERDVSDDQGETVSVEEESRSVDSAGESSEESRVWDTAVIATIVAVVVIVLNKLFQRNTEDK